MPPLRYILVFLRIFTDIAINIPTLTFSYLLSDTLQYQRVHKLIHSEAHLIILA